MAAGIYIELAMDPEAVSALEKAVSADPQNGLLHMQLGRVYLKTGERDRAETQLEEAAALSGDILPDNPTIHYHLGVTYFSLGEKDKARASLQEALRLHPAFPEAKQAEELLGEIGPVKG